MPGKIKLAWIQNAAARKTTFSKRRASLLKKVEELSILTESQTCGIVFNSDGAAPRHWPSEADLQQVIGRFLDLPEVDRHKHATNLESYLRSQIAKMVGQLVDVKMERKEREMNQLMRQISVGAKSLDDLTHEDAYGLLGFMEEKRQSCEMRIQQMNNGHTEQESEEETASTGGFVTRMSPM